jgi:hypothetical protein
LIVPSRFANIDFNASNASAAGYSNGDFNYDGSINADDYSLIDFNLTAQGGPMPAAIAAVPEPLHLTFVVPALLLFRRRRTPCSTPA